MSRSSEGRNLTQTGHEEPVSTALARNPPAGRAFPVMKVEVNHMPLTDQAKAEQIRVNTIFWYFIYTVAVLLVAFVAFCVARDVSSQHERNIKEQVVRLKQCHLDYENNSCHPYNRVPALEEPCSKLELCMKIKPHEEAKITAAFMQVMAESFSAFTNNLGWQALGVLFGFFAVKLLYSCLDLKRRK